MSARLGVNANGVRLLIETFGDPAQPILLLVGVQATDAGWNDRVIGRLVSGDRFVVRYTRDGRGGAAAAEPGQPEESPAALLPLPLVVLDAVDVVRAHVVGVSAGAAEAQAFAAAYPDRVASLTLVPSTPGKPDDDAEAEEEAALVRTLLEKTRESWPERADRLAAASVAKGDATGWFERLYSAARAGEVEMPWEHDDPHPLLAAWARERGVHGTTRSGLVVGCGLGADAEFLASLGFETAGFDVSPSAIDLARERHQGSTVDYRIVDMFDPPPDSIRGFDLVVEIYTVQALPRARRRDAVAAVAAFVAPGGTLLVVSAAQQAHDDLDEGPPWPLTARDIELFAQQGLTEVRVESLGASRPDGGGFWRVELRRDDVAEPAGGTRADAVS